MLRPCVFGSIRDPRPEEPAKGSHKGSDTLFHRVVPA
jgi:hypothetical protein